MTRTIYVEDAVADHPRVHAALAQFPRATRIDCHRYGEVFNPGAQNFRLQKSDPALMLARKHQHHVLPAPSGYGIGGLHNYYFSHMLNCLYDCRYCFLQGMFRSANYIWFVNYEDFAQAIDATLAGHAPEPCWFFSGYDCDSLAFDPLTGFANWALEFFAERPLARLELRTKSTQVRSLLARDALPNVVVAFSFTPHEAHAALEHKVPSIGKRVAAMQRLAGAGWPIGLRFDPLIYSADFEQQYGALFDQVFAALDPAQVHSVSYGSFRLPRGFFRTLVKLYPAEPLFAGPLDTQDGMVAYQQELAQALFRFCDTRLREQVGVEKLFPCVD